MSNNYYDILWVAKTATNEEIKKSYKKLAMKYHPDRNKWDKEAEKKFKEINEAYQVLWDEKKKKQYDQFGNSNFWNFNNWNFNNWNYQWNPFGNFGWWFNFEDIFSGFGWWSQKSSTRFDFDFSEFFGNKSKSWPRSEKKQNQEKEQNLDVTETISIPFIDFLFDTQVSIKTINWKNLKLKIKALTKPWTKFKIKWEWKKINWKTGDMFVIVEAKMPKEIPEHVKKMVEAIRYEL